MTRYLEAAPERIIERLVELLEQPVEDVEAMRRATLAAWRPGAGLAGLERACEAVGMQADRVECAIGEAGRFLAPESALVGQSRSGGWLIITGAHRGSFTLDLPGPVASEERVGLAELAAVLGAGSLDASWPWLVVSGRALAALEVSSGVEEASHGEGGGDDHKPLQRLWGLIKTERQDIGVVLVFAAGVGLLNLAAPVVMQVVVNTVSFGVVLQPLVLLTLVLLTSLGLAAALRAMQVWVVEVIQRRIFLRLAADLAWRLPRVEQRAFDQAHGPELVNRFFDVFTVKKVAASLLLDGVEIVLTALIGALVLAFYHPALLAFDIILIFFVIFIVFILGKKANKTSIKESKAKYAVAGWLQELTRHRHAFRHAGGKRLALERADALSRGYLKKRSAHFSIVYRQAIGLLTLQAVAMTTLVAVGSWLVINRQLTLGQLVAAELIVSVVVSSLSKLSKYLESFYDMVAGMDKLGQLVDLPLERQGGESLCGGGPAGLRLSGVSFTHSSGRRVLSEASLEVAAGERVWITGADGAGLSTLADVIYGLRTPESGWVEVDELDLRSADLSALRLRVAVVREAELVEGTILENVQLGRREVGAQEVRHALARVGLLEEVMAMAGGLQHMVVGSGGALSTSQAVRLTLARAIAGRPRLLVLDEALEQLSEEVGQEVLGELASSDVPWTLVVMGRAPWLERVASRAFRLVDGRLEEITGPDGRGGGDGGEGGGGPAPSGVGSPGGASDPAAAADASSRRGAGGDLRAAAGGAGVGAMAAERDGEGARDRLRADGASAGDRGADQGCCCAVVGAGGEPCGGGRGAAGAEGQRSGLLPASGGRARADRGAGSELHASGGGAAGAGHLRGGGGALQGGVGGGEGAHRGAGGGGVASEGEDDGGEAGDEPAAAGA